MVLVGDTTFHSRTYPPVPPEQEHTPPLQSIDETPDHWDMQNQMEMRDLERTQPNSQELYLKFQSMREAERTEMEKRNRVDNHDVRRSLQDAIRFVGSCQDMCPVYERVRRAYQHNVKDLEMENGAISPNLAVKAFSRPAAGQPPALPSDVRPPSVLVKTLKYMLEAIVPKLPDSHPFLWDRTRSIRQDFTYQNYAGPEAIQCTEMICRIHAVCLHLMLGQPDWSMQQELEQFNKSLRTLDEQYSLRPNRTIHDCPQEPEMRAFQLLSRLFHPEAAYRVESLPSFVVDHPLVQVAFQLRSLVRKGSNNPTLFYDFFTQIRQPGMPVLFQTLCQVHFPTIRCNAIRSMQKSVHKKHQRYNFVRFMKILGFDDPEEARAFCNSTKIPIEGDNVNLENWSEETTPLPIKSKFIDQNLDYNVLLTGSQVSGLPLKQQQHQTKPISFSSTPVPSFAKPPSAPATTNSSTFAPAPSFSGASNQSVPLNGTAKVELKAKPEPPKPAKPSATDIENFVSSELAKIVKSSLIHASQAAVQKIQAERSQRRQQQLSALAEVGKQISDEILAEISKITVHSGLVAGRFRRQNLLRFTLSKIHAKASEAMQVARSKHEKEESVSTFITTLKDHRSARLSAPLPIPSYLSPSPVVASMGDSSTMETSSEVEDDTSSDVIDEALSHASRKGARLILVVADWKSEAGEFFKRLLSLDSNYCRRYKGIAITNNTDERPDITLNIFHTKLPGYLSPTPMDTLGKRTAEVIEQYQAPLPFIEISDTSLNDSSNVSIFTPLKRLASSGLYEAPAKRLSPVRPTFSRKTSSSSVLELRKLISESKKLF